MLYECFSQAGIEIIEIDSISQLVGISEDIGQCPANYLMGMLIDTSRADVAQVHNRANRLDGVCQY